MMYLIIYIFIYIIYTVKAIDALEMNVPDSAQTITDENSTAPECNGISKLNKELSVHTELELNFHNINKSHQYIRQELLIDYAPHKAVLDRMEQIDSTLVAGNTNTNQQHRNNNNNNNNNNTNNTTYKYSNCVHIESETSHIINSIQPHNNNTYKNTMEHILSRYIL